VFEGKLLDLFSLCLSILIHLFVIGFISFKNAVIEKTYRVVSTIPVTFDTEVESTLLGKKPTRGDLEAEELRADSSFQGGGEVSRASSASTGGATAPEGGSLKFKSRKGKGGNLPSRRKITLSTGRGNTRLSVTYDFTGSGRNKRPPAVSYNKLVPYLINLRDRIMSLWTPPYSSAEGNSLVVLLTVGRNGRLEELNVEKLSKDMAFNRSAVSAIYSAEPFGAFPEDVNLEKVRVKVKFEVK